MSEKLIDIESERSVLGAVLLNNDALDEVASILTPESFGEKTHTIIFQAMMDLHGRNCPVDVTTLLNELGDKLSNIGGGIYIGKLTGAVPTSANAEYYAKLVQEKCTLRTLAQLCDITAKQIRHGQYDPRELLDETEDKLIRLFQNQYTYAPEHISKVLPIVIKEMEDLAKLKGNLSGIPLGLDGLDLKLGGWQRSDLIVLAARTSVGKTAFALNAACHAAKCGVPVLFFSLEMAHKQLVKRLLCMDSGVSLEDIKSGFRLNSHLDRLGKSSEYLSTQPIYCDDDPTATLWSIRSKARRHKAKYGDCLIVVDYLQLVKSPGEKKRYLQVGEISRGLKALAKEIDAPVLTCCQIGRSGEDVSSFQMLSHLRESGDIEQDADVVLILSRLNNKDMDAFQQHGGYNIEPSEIVQATIAKHRNGPIGIVNLHFDKARQRFACLTKEKEPIPEEYEEDLF